jgi:hypothetical protein
MMRSIQIRQAIGVKAPNKSREQKILLFFSKKNGSIRLRRKGPV